MRSTTPNRNASMMHHTMRREWLPISFLLAFVMIGVTCLAPLAWPVLLTDGLVVVVFLLAAAGWGVWPVAWLGLGDRSALQQRCIATCFGLGWLALATLALGCLGMLSQVVAWVLVGGGIICGLLRVYLRTHREAENTPKPNEPATPNESRSTAAQWLLLPLTVPLVVMLVGACLPPGLIWPAEANGYDVLEYHLQAPREFYDAGQIHFLPHNVYASFPQQMEMLYLLLMHLAGGPLAAAIMAQLLHAACGILAAVAIGAWSPRGCARYIAILLAGSTPWLAYLGCLAYVENGMLLFAAVGAGLLLDALEPLSNDRTRWRLIVAAGVMAGLAAGCKYTAIVLVALALGVAWLIASREAFSRRLAQFVAFGAVAAAVFSPWMIRNAAFAGNPVYPFAYEWFGGAAWSTEQAAQWDAGHSFPTGPDKPGRAAVAVRELFGHVDEFAGWLPSLFGQILFVLGIVGALRCRSRRVAMLAAWTVLIVVAWMSLTFMPGRFVVVIVVPLALMGACAVCGTSVPRPQRAGHPAGSGASVPRPLKAGHPSQSSLNPEPRTPNPLLTAFLVLLAILGTLTDGITPAAYFAGRAQEWKQQTNGRVPLTALVGQTEEWAKVPLLNDPETVPPDASVWLVGDAAVFYIQRQLHYTVPFSRDPWVEFVESGASPAECLAWLRQRGVTHLAFAWNEIIRLGRTYGFSDAITPEFVQQLEAAGLQRVFSEATQGWPDTAVYRIGP